MKAESKKIKASLLVPLGLAILALLVVSAAAIYRQQRQYINKDMRDHLDEVRRLFNVQIREDSRVLNTITDFVQNDKNVQAAWLAKDRTALLAGADLILKDIRSKYSVTHLYFHDPNRVCFLRVHDPANYNDRIHRFTVDEAVRKKEAVYSITLATFGTFSLRYAQPWYINDNLVGFVELGRKIEHITSQLKESLGVELFFVVKKTCLYREDWEQGLKATGRKGNWELMQHLVITDGTLQEIPAKFPVRIENACESNEQTFFDIPAGNKTYRAGLVPMPDAAGNEVGKIVILKDITESYAALHKLLVILVAAAVLIGGALMLAAYWYIGKIKNRMIFN